jgi:hypothetical protein
MSEFSIQRRQQLEERDINLAKLGFRFLGSGSYGVVFGNEIIAYKVMKDGAHCDNIDDEYKIHATIRTKFCSVLKGKGPNVPIPFSFSLVSSCEEAVTVEMKLARLVTKNSTCVYSMQTIVPHLGDYGKKTCLPFVFLGSDEPMGRRITLSTLLELQIQPGKLAIQMGQLVGLVHSIGLDANDVEFALGIDKNLWMYDFNQVKRILDVETTVLLMKRLNRGAFKYFPVRVDLVESFRQGYLTTNDSDFGHQFLNKMF